MQIDCRARISCPPNAGGAAFVNFAGPGERGFDPDDPGAQDDELEPPDDEEEVALGAAGDAGGAGQG